MSDENDSWLSGIGVDVKGIIGSVQQKATAVMEDVKSAGAAVFEQAQGAVSAAAAAVNGAPAAKPAAAAGPKPAATGKPSSLSALKGSVGQGGTNNPDDVMAVQAALKIAVDGQCGGGTIGAIKAFQKSIGQASPDGRVDPGGATAKALAGGGKSEDDAGVIGGLKALGGKIVDGAKDLGGKLVTGVEDLAGDAKEFVPSALGDVSGANPALANSSGIGVPKLSLDQLTKEQIEAAKKFLAAHLTAGWGGFGSPEDPASYLVALKRKNATIDEIVAAVKAEIPSRVLQNPTAELKDLVQARIRELVAPLVAAAIKAADERKKLRLPDGSFDPNVTREVAEIELTAFLEKVLKAQGGTDLSVTAPVRLAGRALAKGVGPGPTFLEGKGRFPGKPADLAKAIVRTLPASIPRANVEALDRLPVKDVTSTHPPNIAAALAAVVKKEVEAIVKLFPKSIQDDIRSAIPDLIAAGIAALVEHGMEDSALKDKLDDNAKKIIKAIVETSIKQNPDAPSIDRQQDGEGSPNVPDRPQPKEPSQPEQPKIKDEKIIKTPTIKTPDGPPKKPEKP